MVNHYTPVAPWQRRRTRKVPKRRRKWRGEDALPRWSQLLRVGRRRKYGDGPAGAAEVCRILTEYSGRLVTPNSLSHWENGHTSPSPCFYVPLSRIMDLTVEQLLDLLWPRPGGPIEAATRAQQDEAARDARLAQMGEGGGGDDGSAEGPPNPGGLG